MSLDRHAAERRRFARLLGTDGDHGSGLPIGGDGDDTEGGDDRDDADADGDRDDADGDRDGPDGAAVERGGREAGSDDGRDGAVDAGGDLVSPVRDR